MTKGQIKRASEEFSFKQSNVASVRLRIATGFKAGAKWRIDSAWHEASSVPEPYRPVLALHPNEIVSVNMLAKESRCPGSWKKWAYIEDLLPLEKEEQQ